MYSYGKFFRFCRGLMGMFFGKAQIVGQRPADPVVYITHHRDKKGPFFTMLWYPGCIHPWTLSVFCKRKDAFNHLYGYTYTKRRGMPKPVAFAAAHIAAGVFSALMRSGGAIPVYRGSIKIKDTMLQSVSALENGESVVIFPDVDYASTDEQVGEMYMGFLALEKLYYKKTGKHLGFVPVYACERTKTMFIGGPVYFEDGAPFATDKARVCADIRVGLNDLVAQGGSAL